MLLAGVALLVLALGAALLVITAGGLDVDDDGRFRAANAEDRTVPLPRPQYR